jgi:UDP-N-acetylmuramoylalanine--D-glutamate ligase
VDAALQGLNLAGKRVVVLGLARQGKALAHYLARNGARVTVSDLCGEEELADAIEELDGLSIHYVLGEHPLSLLDGVDIVYVSGGVSVDIPVVAEARRRGIPISNEAQVFLERCPAPVIGVTGSSGKTTTTALTGEMCRAAGFRTWVGGNIGNPLIADVDEIRPSNWVVMELSSFQLEVMTISPHIAAVTNITPNHLDRHGAMEVYIAAKRNIVAHQGAEDLAVLGYDDANARSLALDTAAHLLWFSDRTEVEEGAFRTNGELTLRLGGEDRTICHVSEIKLLGRHNLLNVLAASALAGAAGASLEAIRHVAMTFSGVEHRLELVREMDGVRWYDDSIATTPERSLAALRSFENPIVLLAGGRDKDLPWGEFAEEAVQRVRYLVTFGKAGPMIARVVKKALNGSARERRLKEIAQVDTMEEAVEVAARVIRPGDVVLLSPGGTSFDAFRDFAERGDRFKQLVRKL